MPAGGSVGVEAAPPSPATSEDAGGPVAVAATAAVSDPLGATAAASGPVAGAAAVAAAAQARAIAGALAPSSVIAASDLTIAVGYASLIDADARWRAAEAVTAVCGCRVMMRCRCPPLRPAPTLPARSRSCWNARSSLRCWMLVPCCRWMPQRRHHLPPLSQGREFQH